jgi:XTP/dITP diphosphohydrolase
MLKEFILATKNKGKVVEITHLLRPLKLKVLSLQDIDWHGDIKEDGKTFKANAIKKASVIANKLNTIAIADDSGLEVRALHGKPGVRSARYAGSHPTTAKLCRKLLRAMKDKRDRSARFVCNIAIAMPGDVAVVVEGVCRGRIAKEMSGSRGFGYDPVFIPSGHSTTFAQMPMGAKNLISHRGRALKKAKAVLARIFSS